MKQYQEFREEWNDRQNERPLLAMQAKIYRLPNVACKDMELQYLASEMPYLILCNKILIKISPQRITLVNPTKHETVWVNGNRIPAKAEYILKRNDLISTRSMNWVITDHDYVDTNPFKIIINQRKQINSVFMMSRIEELYQRINEPFRIHVHDTSLDTSERNYMMRKFCQYLQVGNYQSLLEETGKLIEGGIEDTEVFNMHGLALEEFGRNDDALEMYRRANVIEPDHPGILHNMKRLS